MHETLRGCGSQPRSKKLPGVLWAFALAALCLNFCLPLRAQEVTAGITGTITDPSGAPIPGAKVTATDVLRGTTWPTETNPAGVFDLPRLPISTYDLTVEAQGFATAARKGITLEMNQKARIDIQLQMGTVTQTVEVVGGTPLLTTDTMQLGTVITGNINQDLPLATRNYVELTLLAPGVTNPNPGGFTEGDIGSFTASRPYVNGNREQSDNFLLDGMDNNQVSDNLIGYTPSVDAIQEFNMITNNAPAEFGNFQGAIVSASIKSGTNQLHGNGFEFFRNDVLNAAQWSNNIAPGPAVPKSKIRWNMFGGTVGGPIKKDKLFFFGDYQGERFDTPASAGNITVFTNKERAGDFSEICSAFDATGKCTNGIQLYNPYKVDANGNRALIPNNNLAAAGLTIDPVAQKLFSASFYPAPLNGNLRNNQLNTFRTEISGDQFDVKIDANLTQKDRLFGRTSWSRQEIPGINSFLAFFNSFSHTPTRNEVLDWTRTINPGLVNEVRVGVNYVKVNSGAADNGLGNAGQELGIAGANDRGPGLPALQGFTFANAIGQGNSEVLFGDTVIQAEDTLIITHSRHVFHTGFQFFRQRINSFYAGNYGKWGIINFDGQWTAGPGDHSTLSATTGFPEADFWLGLPEAVQRGVDTGTWGQRSNVFAGYLQDDWRATGDLTVNLGLRYETHTPWGEVHNRQANFGEITGTEYFAGQSGCPYNNCNALYNSYNGGFDFQPRIGFAWNPSFLNKKTVVRGAYTTSTYLEGTGTNLRLPLNPPFAEEHNTFYDALTFPGSITDQGFTVLTSPSDPFANAVIRLWNPDVKPSLAQQWNFSIERQLPYDTVISLGYVGQNATHLMNPMPYFQKRLPGEAGCPSSATSPCPSPYLSGNPALANINQISGTESNADMLYHSLQATLQKRFSQGLQYQVAYTYSKCMTNSIGYYGSWGGQVVPTAAYWQNLYDSHSEWAACESDVTHLLSSYAVYELPFGRKRKFGSNWNSITNGVLGNWQVSGILQLRGGFPSTVFADADASGTGERTQRAVCLHPATYPKTPVPSGGIQWADPADYGPQFPGTFYGTCGVATLRGPGLRTFDLGVEKNIAISESKRIEFRSEFVNFTNTPILNAPGVWIGGGFGQITSSQGARNIQFGLKIYY
jgi:carboxypeptidase family protein